MCHLCADTPHEQMIVPFHANVVPKRNISCILIVHMFLATHTTT